MTVTDTDLSEQTTDRETHLAARLATVAHELEVLQESMHTLELQREDAGWDKLMMQHEADMSREGIIRAAKTHRAMAVANPLVRRGLYLTAAYTIGSGVGTVASGEKVNQVVQDFLDDPVVRKTYSGSQALERAQVALGTDGNVFTALPTDPSTGEVTVRDIPLDEVTEIITAPGDRETTHYYIRSWSELDPVTGRTTEYTVAYPDVAYRPLTRHRAIRVSRQQSIPVEWDTPVVHSAANLLKGQKWGTADAFSAVPWARAYTEFLNDWARLMKSLSRIAYKVSSKKAGRTRQQREALAGADRLPAGSTAVMDDDTSLEPMPKTGATIDSESARPLATMVAAAFGMPVTTLLSDPGQTGARAVAETLNLPTRLLMASRQEDDRETRRTILSYVILQAVRAPLGALRGRGRVVRKGDMEHVVFRDSSEGTLTIDYPEIDDTPVETLVSAIATADATGKVPELVTAERLLRALNIRDVDEILDTMRDAEGNFVAPGVTSGVAAGQAAAAALRRGESPADYL